MTTQKQCYVFILLIAVIWCICQFTDRIIYILAILVVIEFALNSNAVHESKQPTVSLTFKLIKNEPLGKTFNVPVVYSKDTKMKVILDQAIHLAKTKYNIGRSYSIKCTTACPFINDFKAEQKIKADEIMLFSKEWHKLETLSITDFPKNHLALSFIVEFRYTHTIINNPTALCPYIKQEIGQNDNINPLQCPIFYAMKIHHKYCEDYIDHLYNHPHFIDEVNDKEVCKHGLDCKSFIKLQTGSNDLSDRCHIKLYRHPPRSNRQIIMNQGINSFIFNTHKKQNKQVYEPVNWNLRKEKIVTGGLMDEVIKNGYKYDLCMICKKQTTPGFFSFLKKNACCHNVKERTKESVLSIVYSKLSHQRHVKMGRPLRADHMLALILYTGGDCNYDLCKSQRNGNYKKWKWFDYCLFEAIWKLSAMETGQYKLYSGLSNIKLNKKNISDGFFPTYTSASWDKRVARCFIKENKGMILEIVSTFRHDPSVMCCDVSWISKFEDECEILIARSAVAHIKGEKLMVNHFTAMIVDEENGVQNVLLESKLAAWTRVIEINASLMGVCNKAIGID